MGFSASSQPIQTLVADVPSLVAALKACVASCLITLAPGDWRDVRIDNVKAHATLVGSGAVIHDLTLRNSSGITFSGLEFSTVGAPAGVFGPGSNLLYKINQSSNITFDKLRVHGDAQGTLADTASGFLVRDSSYVTVSNSEFSYLHHALSFLNDEHLTFSHNTFHNLFDDSMRGGGASWVTIKNNKCYSNHPDLTDKDHPDCIQFWTSNTKSTAHDITITGNTFERGTGNSTQFIFFGNESSVPYQNIVISDNSSFGAAWNGIVIVLASNVKITGNHLYPSCRLENSQMLNTWILSGKVDEIGISDNVAGGFIEKFPNSKKTQYNNRTVGCLDRSPF